MAQVTIYEMTLEGMGHTSGKTVSRVKSGARKHEKEDGLPELISEKELPTAMVRVRCSKGTYVRSIARDLGERLGSGGFLTSLVRTRSGNYGLEGCYSIEDIEKILAPVKQI